MIFSRFKSFSMVAVLLAMLIFFNCAVARQNADYHSCPFTFKLHEAASTSAGIYNNEGILVKTLWSGVRYQAGTHQAVWDGTNDDGNLLPAARYQVRVLSNNVKYTWEGVMGNTSEKFTGPTIFKAHNYIRGIAITGKTAYYATGYSEQSSSTMKFNTQRPSGKTAIPVTGIECSAVATDDKLVYWVAFEIKTNTNFIYATNTTNDDPVNFTGGNTITIVKGKARLSALERSTSTDNISGLAVQRNGKYLISAHLKTNQLHVLDKLTGAAVSNISVTSPGAVVAIGENNVWVSCISNGKPVVVRYEISSNGTLKSTSSILPGLVKPLAMAISPDGLTLLVADGGDSQQLKAYDSRLGVAKWTFGQEGGYSTNADVRNDKFYFSNVRKELGTCLAFDTDGSFWVEDSGNSRLQHYTAGRTFINRVMYLPVSYSMSVNHTDATRVFSDYLEFKVDYTKPLQPDNGSWALVKNWGALIPNEFDRKYSRLKDIITLKNGRTYTLLGSTKKPVRQVVELTDQGLMRFTNEIIPVNYSMDNSGNLYRISNFKIGQPNIWYTKKLNGFDAANDPIWGPETEIASTQPATTNDILNEGTGINLNGGEITSSNILLAFNPKASRTGNTKPHLGGVKLGGRQWLWQTAAGTHKGYRGNFPANGAFDNGNNVAYAGSVALAVERSIFWGYYGEFWKASETNKWNQVYDDGLFVGQFGTVGTKTSGTDGSAMMAGNAMSARVVKDSNGHVYLYHNDESTHGGLHRWKISNLSSIAEQAIAVNLVYSKQGLTTEYFKGTDLNNLNILYTGITTNNTFAETVLPGQLKNSTRSLSVRLSGFIKPANTASYVFQNTGQSPLRLWINNNLIIDDRNNKGSDQSKPVELFDSLAYAIKIEYLPTSALNGISLAWSENGKPMKPVTAMQLFPAERVNGKQEYNLLAGLPFDSALEDGRYGWYRDKKEDDRTNSYKQWWSVHTSLSKYDKLTPPDLSIAFRQTKSVNTVTRNLGNHTPVKQWQISGLVNWGGNYANWGKDLSQNGSGGSFMEVLDDAGKILTRLFFSVDTDTSQAFLYANHKAVLTTDPGNLWTVMSGSSPFTIRMEDGMAAIKYGSYATVSVPAFDDSAVWSRPKTFRLYFWSKTKNDYRTVDIEELYYSFK